MYVYFFALIVSVFLSLILTCDKFKYDIFFHGKNTIFRVFLSLFPLYLVSIIKWNVGVDVVYGTGYYYIAYDAITRGYGNIFGYEIGFYLMMKICNVLGLNVYFFYCIITTLFFLCFSSFLTKNISNITLAIIIFVISDLYLFSFSTLRQSLAIAFLLTPMNCIIKDRFFYKRINFWVCSIISVSMHLSAFYLLTILIVSRLRFDKKKLSILMLFICVLSPFLDNILSYLISYSYYFEKYIGTNDFSNKFTISYFIISILVLLPMFHPLYLCSRSDEYSIFYNFAIFNVIFMAFSNILIMPYRIFQLCVPMYIIIIDSFLDILCRSTQSKLLFSLLYIIPLSVMMWNQYYNYDTNSAYEFKSIFQFIEQVFESR